MVGFLASRPFFGFALCAVSLYLKSKEEWNPTGALLKFPSPRTRPAPTHDYRFRQTRIAPYLCRNAFVFGSPSAVSVGFHLRNSIGLRLRSKSNVFNIAIGRDGEKNHIPPDIFSREVTFNVDFLHFVLSTALGVDHITDPNLLDPREATAIYLRDY
jgi:hypothetical protein